MSWENTTTEYVHLPVPVASTEEYSWPRQQRILQVSKFEESHWAQKSPVMAMVVPIDGNPISIPRYFQQHTNLNDSSLPTVAGFIWNSRQGYLYWHDAKIEKPIPISNFCFEIVKEISEIDVSGQKKQLLQLHVWHSTDTEPLVFKINKKEWVKLYQLLPIEYPECFIEHGMDNYFKKYSHERYERRRCQEEIRYCFHGWLDSKKLTYLHAGMDNVTCNIRLLPNQCKAAAFYRYYINACCSRLADLLIIYSMYGYLAAFFEKLHIEGCRSVLVINGPSGCGKTAITKIIAQALWLNGGGVHRFDDTVASLEENILAGRDSVICVDDFYPRTATGVKDFQNKASIVTRIVGDGRVKGKMGVDRKPIPDRHYRGAVICTGESFSLEAHSSYLRCVMLSVQKGDISLRDLTPLQQRPDLSTAFFSSWIIYLENNQNYVLNYIRNNYQPKLSLCNNLLTGDYARLSSSFAALLLACDLVKGFLHSINAEFNARMEDSIVNAISSMSEVAIEYSPVHIVQEAIKTSLENADIRLALSPEGFNEQDVDGYQDDGVIFVITSKLEKAILKFAAAKNLALDFNTSLKEALVEAGLLVKCGESFNKKWSRNRKVNNSRPRLYAIKIREE